MRKLPEVAGLILCKRMEVNTATVELCLAGLFHTLEFSKWPAFLRVRSRSLHNCLTLRPKV